MPLQNVHFIEADIKEKKIMEEPRVVANDDIAFIVSITDNGNSIDTSLVTQTVLASVRPDRKTVITPGVLLEDGTVKFELGHTETQKSGQVKATAQLFDSEGDRISSIAFSYQVERDPTGEEYIPTEKDKTFIEIVLVEGPEVIQQAKEATAAAQQATSNADTATGRADIAASGAESVINEFSGFKESTAKGKSFGTVDERFEELEKDSYLPARNIILNGNFESALGWGSYASTLSVSNNTMSVTGTGASTFAYLTKPISFNEASSKKVYFKMNCRVTNGEVQQVGIEIKMGSTTASTTKTLLDKYKNNKAVFSEVVSINPSSHDASLTIRHGYATSAIANGKTMEVEKVLMIDLTQVFGAGNEPTVEEMDKLLAFYPESWFDGTVNLAENKKLVTFLLNQLRGKATKKQESWITPTLLSGWVQDGAFNIGFYKDDMGIVRLKGRIKSGTMGSDISVLPAGYRPNQLLNFPVICGGGSLGFLQVSSTGAIKLLTGNNVYVTLDNIAFKND